MDSSNTSGFEPVENAESQNTRPYVSRKRGDKGRARFVYFLGSWIVGEFDRGGNLDGYKWDEAGDFWARNKA
jgi:hypothetical protein